MAKTLCFQGWGPGSITGQGIQSHILQLKTLCAATKTQGSQINKYFLKDLGDEKARRSVYQLPFTSVSNWCSGSESSS